MLIVNLFGAPSAGKSTTASYLFYELKKLGFNCELVTEVAKELCWQNDEIGLRNQMYVAGNQIMRIDRLRNKVDVVITDAPLMLQTIYYRLNNCPKPDFFEEIIYEEHKKDDSVNILLKSQEIKSEGRIWLDKVEEIESDIIKLLEKHDIDYYNSDFKNSEGILGIVLRMLHYKKNFN